jgi:hypothetical protein
MSHLCHIFGMDELDELEAMEIGILNDQSVKQNDQSVKEYLPHTPVNKYKKDMIRPKMVHRKVQPINL